MNITEDSHESERAARFIAQRLDQDGFGGDRKIFPVATWIEPIIEEIK